MKWLIGIFGTLILSGFVTLLLWLGEIRSTQRTNSAILSDLVTQVKMQGVPTDAQFHDLWVQVDQLRSIHLANGDIKPGG